MSWNDDDEVGYGRPPRWTRFVKGRSGNPNGRPRKLSPEARSAPAPSEHDDILRRSLEQVVEITEGGKRRRVKIKEVVQRRQVQEAAKGSVYALAHTLRASQELEERDRKRELQEAETDALVFAHMKERRASQVRLWQAAAAEGREPSNPWPHPDDFFIDEVAQQWEIRGPSKMENVELYEIMRADRDVHHMHSVIEITKGPSRRSMAAFNGRAFLDYDAMLPKRWQKGIEGWQEETHFLLQYPAELLEAALVSVERHAASFRRPKLSKEDARDVYQTTDRLMRPLLKQMGYRSLKQLEAAYQEHGAELLWPRKADGDGPRDRTSRPTRRC